jgi:hypothetical protein
MVDGRRVNEEMTMKMLGRLRLVLVGAGVLLAMLAVSTGSTWAAGFKEFTVTPSTTQAGGHPNVRITAKWQFSHPFSGQECLPECLAPRIVESHLPTGFTGNPHAAPVCTLKDFNEANCPVDSQVGWFNLAEELFGISLITPAYNMETRPTEAGLVAFTVPFLKSAVFLELTGRTDSDYGLTAISSPIFHLPIPSVDVVLWGVPADPANNTLRFETPLSLVGGCYTEEGCPVGGGEFEATTFAEPSVPERPYLQNPTTCGVQLTAAADLSYYDGQTDHAETSWPPTTGCQQLSFNPSMTVKPTTTASDTASGVDVELKVPQTQSPTTPAPSMLRTSRVTLPEGLSINPNAADGKLFCSDFDTSIGTRLAATCPEFSKVGTLSLDVAALPEPILGAIYLGESKPGEKYRLILTGDGFATHVKLAGTVVPDPQTGQLSIEFVDLPQQTLQVINMHFFGSERGLLATPTRCGKYEVKGEFVPWDSALSTYTSTSFATIDSGPGGSPCPGASRPFSPQLTGGMGNSTPGAHAPFRLRLSREDGDQNLAGLNIKTPPGFAATLKGVPYCSESAIAQLSNSAYSGVAEQMSSACPASSLIGTVTTGAGAGTHPLYTPGKVYLAGPYKGAPVSLVAIVPAVSGPYDLGNVAVRATIDIDPVTAQVNTVTDPLPQVLEGIPLRLRSILIDLDRPGFTLNPTNCDPFSLGATVLGSEGGQSQQGVHFQVSNCADLPYAPKLSLKLTGGLNRRGHPALKATFTAQPGEANTRHVTVALPEGELLDNAHIGNVCTKVQFAAGACPAASVLGSAEVTTPILEAPLKGNVYLRSSSNNLPDIVLDLKGQFDFELVGRVDTAKGGALRTSFENAPDVPVTQLVLNLAGGAKGLLVNSESLCKKPKRATTTMTGQNGVVVKTKTKLQTSCASKKARHKRHGKRAGR